MSAKHREFLKYLKDADINVSVVQDARKEIIDREKKRIEDKPVSEITLAEQNWYTSQFGMTRF